MTPQAARRRIGSAVRASQAAAQRYARDEITQAEFWAILEAEEDLRILAAQPTHGSPNENE